MSQFRYVHFVKSILSRSTALCRGKLICELKRKLLGVILGNLLESGKKNTCIIVSYEISDHIISLVAYNLTYEANPDQGGKRKSQKCFGKKSVKN